jgi:hypothetical protein
MGVIELLAYQTTVDIPFSTTAIVDGTLESNNSGVSSAMDLLTEPERTMVLRGVLRISDVSNGNYSTSSIPGAPQCDGNKIGNLVLQKSPVIIPPGITLDPHKFLNAKAFTEKSTKMRTMGVPTIGPADGTSYEVLYTTEIFQPATECGFNDVGSPIIRNILEGSKAV